MAQALGRGPAGRNIGPGSWPPRQRPARRGENPPGARHRRPRVPSQRRSARYAPPQIRLSDDTDWQAQGGRDTARDLEKDVRSLPPRGLRAARRASRHRRGPRVARDGALDQVRGGC